MEEECRICRCGEETGRLFTPCLCAGSVQHVHQECLQHWLVVSGKTVCELCGYQFTWTHQYKSGAPEVLPTLEFLAELCWVALSWVDFLLRILLSLFSCAVVTPVLTMWMWRMLLESSLDFRRQWAGMTLTLIMRDTLCGSLVSVSMVLLLHFFGYRHPESSGPLLVVPEEFETLLHTASSEHIQVPPHDPTQPYPADPDPDPFDHHQDQEFRLEVSETYGWIAYNTLLVLLSNWSLLAIFLVPPTLLAQLLGRYLPGYGQPEIVAGVLAGYSVLLSGCIAWMVAIILDEPVEAAPPEPAPGEAQGPAPPSPEQEANPMGEERGDAGGRVTTVNTMWLVLQALKIGVMLLVETAFSPIACGILIDLCTLSVLGCSAEDRRHFFAVSPIVFICVHWAVGFLFMVVVALGFNFLTTSLLHARIPFASWLIGTVEHANHPAGDFWAPIFALQVRDFVLSTLGYIPLVLLLVGVPCWANSVICPWILPLSASLSSNAAGFPAELVCFHIALPLLLEYCDVRAQLGSLSTATMHSVADALGVSAYLFAEDADLMPEEHRNAHSLPVAVRLRLGAFFAGLLGLLLIWLTYMLSLSVMVGRWAFLVAGLEHTKNDILGSMIGCCALSAGMNLMVTLSQSNTQSLRQATAMMVHSAWRIMVVGCLLLLWAGVIPLLLGFLLELCVGVHLRLGWSHQTAVFAFHQDWALGLFLLKWWARGVMMSAATPGESQFSWRRKFSSVYATDGSIAGGFVLQQIIAPITLGLVTALALPYTAGMMLCKVCGADPTTTALVLRMAYLVCMLLCLVWWLSLKVRYLVRHVHDRIRDSKYSIGRQLHDRVDPAATMQEEEQDEEEPNILGESTVPDVAEGY